MKVAVSGGLGFIGSRLAERLAAAGHTVVVLDNAHPQVHRDETARRRVEAFAGVRIGDVRDPQAWDEVLDGADLVLHMAAETGTGQSMDEISRYVDVNIGGAAVLAEALARHPSVRTVFLPSSRAIYGEGAYLCNSHGVVLPERRSEKHLISGEFELRCPICNTVAQPVPTPESAEPRPASIYASTKLSQEQILQLACASRGVDLRIARYQNVYGPGQALGNPYTGVLVIFAQQIAAGHTLNLYEDGMIARDFVYIDDVVQASLLILETPLYAGPVNVGTGQAVTLIDIVRSFGVVLGREIDYHISGDFRFGDIRYAAADVLRLASMGFTASTELSTGLRNVLHWARGDS